MNGEGDVEKKRHIQFEMFMPNIRTRNQTLIASTLNAFFLLARQYH